MTVLAHILLALIDLSSLPGNNCLPSIRRHAPGLLEEYRYPSTADLDGYWAFYVEEYSSVPFCDAGDLNDDGIVDYLAVLVPRTPPGVRVVAMLSAPGGGRTAITLLESRTPELAPYEFVVEVVRPGVHKYLCAYTVDDADGSPPIRLSQAAARFWTRPPGQAQGVHYLFFWQASKGTFSRTEPCVAK